MRRLFAFLGCLAAGLVQVAGVSPVAAEELVPAEKRVIPYSANLPTCGDPAVLEQITSRFAEKEAKFWGSPLQIIEYAHIKPLAWRAWGLGTIPRRFCTASAYVSDGVVRRVDYSVREDLGFLGVGWDVQWCFSGLDRNLSYAPACRMARP